MKEILDIVVLVGFVYILFIFLRGMNETQVEKHKERLEKIEKQKQQNIKEEE